MRVRVLSIVVWVGCTVCAAGGASSLEAARDLAKTKYEGYTYGTEGEKKIDCTSFVLAVVERMSERCAVKMTTACKRRITMADLTSQERERLQSMVEAGDRRVSGVQSALVDAKLGVSVEPAKAKAGDFVQYWYRENREWRGHAGLVEEIIDGKATIYGAHYRSLKTESNLAPEKRKGGIGSGASIDLSSKDLRVFVVRWIKEP